MSTSTPSPSAATAASGSAAVVPLVAHQPYPVAHPSASLPAAFFVAASSAAAAAAISAESAPRGGILWDLDGTLVESKEIWQHLLNACSQALGYGPLAYEVWNPTFGQSMQANRDMFFPNHSQEEVDQYCYDHYGDYVEKYLHVLPGAEDALKAARDSLRREGESEEQGCERMAICTNCPLPITQQIVRKCPMLTRYFSPERTICSGMNLTLRSFEEVWNNPELKRLHFSSSESARLRDSTSCSSASTELVYELKPKPCGDIIHAACARLGLRAERCLFVGDSKYDLMSSTTAGCFAVGIGEKGRGGHFHVDTVAQLATKLEEATKAARVGSL